MNGRNWCKTDARRALRHAVEIRHESFRNREFIALLRRYKIALVCADTVEWPRLMDLTADFVYCRLHGSEQLYASGYDPDCHRCLGESRAPLVARRRAAQMPNAPAPLPGRAKPEGMSFCILTTT